MSCPSILCIITTFHSVCQSVSLVCDPRSASVGYKGGHWGENTCSQSDNVCCIGSHGSSLPPSIGLFPLPHLLGNVSHPVKLQAEREAGEELTRAWACRASCPHLGCPSLKGIWGSTGSTYLPSVMAMGPASSAPRRPPTGYRDTMRDHRSGTSWSGSGRPVRIRHVSLVNS